MMNLFTQKKMIVLVFLFTVGLTSAMQAQVNFYFTPSNGWNMKEHVRTLGDINGDDKDDIVGFGAAGVYVSFSDGLNFSVPKLLLKNFAIGAGAWEVSKHVRTTGDVNGDGKDDIIGFGGGAVLVSLSTGDGLAEAKVWLDRYFTPPNGWNNREHVRTVADVNNDGKDDIVGFGAAGVYVSFSDGRSFSKPQLLVKNFAIGAGGWEVSKHTRLMADVDGDRRADIVGFGGQVYTAFSEGKTFRQVKEMGEKYYTNPNWWNLQRHRRMMEDTNGDGKMDIIGFTEQKVYVSLSEGESFQTQKMCFEEFTYAQGWSPEKYPIVIGDVNGDGKADIVGFKDKRVYVAYSNGDCFNPPVPINFSK
ncbi:MAG: VCBS repeat-containing protein [Bacteroidota bacterium]